MPERNYKSYFLIIVFNIAWIGPVFISDAKGQSVVSTLDNGWKFRKASSEEWMPASVPGTVHTDLLSNKIIPDPFFGDNEKRLQWIDSCDWEYQLEFAVNDTGPGLHQELLFEGLDTYADVFLNDSLLLKANNMFRSWSLDCGNFFKRGSNKLLIHFYSALIRGKQEAEKSPYPLPGDERVFTRKAQCHYGWDWGPRFITCGIWKPVYLISWRTFKIEQVRLVTQELKDSTATVIVSVRVSADKPVTLDCSANVDETDESSNRKIIVDPGMTAVELPVQILNPKKWWCNGFGEPFLYHLSVSITDANSGTASRSIACGLRTLELVQEEEESGRSFFFRLNGVPVFMKGANWIPADAFLPRLTREKYVSLLQSEKEANMNMLRVWGGGVYENDVFYNQCDSLGLLVWQDFMFACGMVPGNKSFRENVAQEVSDNVIRLRNHPCIAIWCGNNELDEGWKNWGWQKQYGYTPSDSDRIWKDYLALFHEQIPGQLAQIDPERPYWESSPSIGWGHKESLERGDSHYWGVWWGAEPFSRYQYKVGRFMSEYGFQGMPSMESIRSFTHPADRALSSAAMKNHQKHPTGFETIDHYMKDWYKPAKDFESTVYLSQLLQAEGIRIAIESHRRAMPYCMGSLYWQLNDCWPVTSWSSMDYTGAWKALHYAVKSSFQKYLISVTDTGSNFDVYVVSDDVLSPNLRLAASAFDFSGRLLWMDSASVPGSYGKPCLSFQWDKSAMKSRFDFNRTVILLELFRGGIKEAEKCYYLSLPRELALEKPEIKYQVSGSPGKYRIAMSSGLLAKNVFLEVPGQLIHFSENYFDLLPGRTKTISFSSPQTIDEVRHELVIRSLVDSY